MARCLMPILVIALLALAAFFGVGVLLVMAMFFENRKKALDRKSTRLNSSH